MSYFELPAGVFLGWRYTDRQRGIERTQLYHEDGRVELVEGDERTDLCRLNDELVAAAKGAIGSSGITTADDASAAGAADTAAVVYAWRLDVGEGSVTNEGYPARTIAAVERLEAELARIEEEAGCGPLMADAEAAAEYAAMDD